MRRASTAAIAEVSSVTSNALRYLPSEDKTALPSRAAYLEFFLPLGRSEFMHNLAATIRDSAPS